MPLMKMKNVWDYCTYNKPFFLLILFFCCLWVILDLYTDDVDTLPVTCLVIILDIAFFGYGMTLTRDRINNGFRLPKIMIKDILELGVKSFIVYVVYLGVQGYILDFICSPLKFPEFDLEDMLLDTPETIHLLYTHNPFDTLIFLVVGAVLFYITVFFMEIALARLADTGSLKSAFELVEIKKDIDTIGWRNYAKDYTRIVIAIVFFAYITVIQIPNDILNFVWCSLLNLFIFVTQYLGIGAIYSYVKEKEKEKSDEAQSG